MKRSIVNKFGFWSAILITLFTLWFTIAFVPYISALKWINIEDFSASFQSTSYLIWVIPCLLLAITFPVLISAVHFATDDSRKFFSWLGLIYAVMYSAILSTNYWILMTVVRTALINHQTSGLDWFVVGSPNSITNSIEGIGYGFMGLSTLFAGFSFGGNSFNNIIKYVLIFNGLAGLMGVVFGAIGYIPATMVSLVLWCMTFPIATGLLVYNFYKSKS